MDPALGPVTSVRVARSRSLGPRAGRRASVAGGAETDVISSSYSSSKELGRPNLRGGRTSFIDPLSSLLNACPGEKLEPAEAETPAVMLAIDGTHAPHRATERRRGPELLRRVFPTL